MLPGILKYTATELWWKRARELVLGSMKPKSFDREMNKPCFTEREIYRSHHIILFGIWQGESWVCAGGLRLRTTRRLLLGKSQLQH